MIRRLASISACALALTVIGATSAQAAERSFTDERGDVWTMHEDPNTRVPNREQGDITRFSLQHQRQQIVVRVRFVELNRAGRFLEVFTQLRTNTGKVSTVELDAGPNRWSGRTSFQRGDGRDVGCLITHDINYAENVAVVRIPRSCIDDPRTVQAKFGVATVANGRAFADNPITQGPTQHLPRYTAPVRVG